MHPPLDRPHPDCQDFVEALNKCHKENEWKKFMGACNEPKALMDICFREEKERKRHANMLKAREFDAKFEAYMAASEKAEEKAGKQ